MRRGLVILGVALLLAAYVASPYISIYRIAQAISNRDTAALETYADWPALREQLRTDLKGFVTRALDKENQGADGFQSGLVTFLAPMMVDRLVDANVNPDGLIRLVDTSPNDVPPTIVKPADDDRQSDQSLESTPHNLPSSEKGQNEKKSAASDEDPRNLITYAFFSGLTHFRVDAKNPRSDSAQPMTLLMEFRNFGWQVTRIKLPLSQLAKEFEANRAQAPQSATPDSESSAAKKEDRRNATANGQDGGRIPQSGGSGGFKLCNTTGSRVGIAIGYKDDSGWTTQGWWSVSARACETLLSGPLRGRYFYLHAIDYDRGGAWAGNLYMCTDEKSFTIHGNQDCLQRGYKRTGFFEVDTGNEQEWTARITDPE
jgi:uncharacterized membrane protein